jgi:hypothetical protein
LHVERFSLICTKGGRKKAYQCPTEEATVLWFCLKIVNRLGILKNVFYLTGSERGVGSVVVGEPQPGHR